MKVDVYAALSPERRDALVAAVASHDTLERVIHWGLAHRPPKLIERVVVQDEYTHDVVLRAADDAWLVYDTT